MGGGPYAGPVRSGPLFHLFGIPVRVDPFFGIVIVFLGLSYLELGPEFLASWMVIASSSVLLHELGHALAFKSFGVQPTIALVGLGGLTSGEGRITPVRHIVVSLAGPLATLVLIGLPALLYQSSLPHTPRSANPILEQVILANVWWALLNLLPVLPLDGGQVVASLLEIPFKQRGRQIAVGLSLAVGVGLIYLGWRERQIFFGFIGALVLMMNVGQLGGHRARVRYEQLDDAQQALINGRPRDAERMLVAALAGRADPATRVQAAELLAWSRLLSGDVWGAQHALSEAPGRHSQVLNGALTVAAGRADEGLAVITWGLVNEPAGPAKLLGAIAMSRAGLIDRLANELALLGPQGLATLRVVRELLAYVGLTDDAQRVWNVESRGPGHGHGPAAGPAASAG